jgi:hypothetical protein
MAMLGPAARSFNPEPAATANAAGYTALRNTHTGGTMPEKAGRCVISVKPQGGPGALCATETVAAHARTHFFWQYFNARRAMSSAPVG